MDERNITFMFYGLAVAWGLLAVYAVLLGLREKNLQKQLDTLKRIMEEKTK
jgi:CcmD family protein